MKVRLRLVDSKSKEIDVPVKLEKVVAEFRAEAEVDPGAVTGKMKQLMREMEEIMGLKRGKIKAVLSTAWWGARVVGRKWNVTLYFFD